MEAVGNRMTVLTKGTTTGSNHPSFLLRTTLKYLVVMVCAVSLVAQFRIVSNVAPTVLNGLVEEDPASRTKDTSTSVSQDDIVSETAELSSLEEPRTRGRDFDVVTVVNNTGNVTINVAINATVRFSSHATLSHFTSPQDEALQTAPTHASIDPKSTVDSACQKCSLTLR
jgi:hypothetical protein